MEDAATAPHELAAYYHSVNTARLASTFQLVV